MNSIKTVFVTGGAGYVGAVLVPQLLERGYRVRVLDLYLYGDAVLQSVANHPGLEQIKGDIRDRRRSNGPARLRCGHPPGVHFERPELRDEPELGKSINYDAFFDLVAVARSSGVQPIHLRLVVERLRRQGRGQRHRRPSARAADRLLEVQGALRRGAAEGTVDRASPPSCCGRPRSAAIRRACGST